MAKKTSIRYCNTLITDATQENTAVCGKQFNHAGECGEWVDAMGICMASPHCRATSEQWRISVGEDSSGTHHAQHNGH